MKRLLIILLIINSFNIKVKAESRPDSEPAKLSWGVEWNYIGTFHSGYHFNFFSAEGYRYDMRGNRSGYHSNADVCVYGGINLKEGRDNISIYLGLAGAGDIHKVIPVNLRYTRFFRQDSKSDRWFCFIDAGSGICIKQEIQETAAAKIGGGYRLALGREVCIDFLIAGRLTYTHPQIVFEGNAIPLSSTNRNNAYISGISVGMALSFK